MDTIPSKDRNGHHFDVVACVRLVNISYQIDLFLNGKPCSRWNPTQVIY